MILRWEMTGCREKIKRKYTKRATRKGNKLCGEKRGKEQKENSEELTFTRDGSGILVQLLKVSLEGPESMPHYL